MIQITNKKELIEKINKEITNEKRYASMFFDTDNNGRRLEDYHDFAREYARCRKPSMGRKISSAFRLFKDTDKLGVVSYVIHLEGYGSKPFMRITPDNIVEFVATPEEMWHNAQSIVTSSYRWIPFVFERHKRGLYRVQHAGRHTKQMESKVHAWCKDKLQRAKMLPDNASEQTVSNFDDENFLSAWRFSSKLMKVSPAYYQGLKFDIITGECFNRRATDRFIEKPKERKVWRQTLARFKKGIKARAKVRALDPFVNEVWVRRQSESNRYHWKQPDWSSESWIGLLEQSMRDNVFPRELLIGFCMTPHTGYYQQSKPTSSDVAKSVDKILNDLSIELRRRFDVFKSEGHDDKKQERYHYSWGDKNITLEEVSKI